MSPPAAQHLGRSDQAGALRRRSRRSVGVCRRDPSQDREEVASLHLIESPGAPPVAKGDHSVKAFLIIGNPTSLMKRILLFTARHFEYHEE